MWWIILVLFVGLALWRRFTVDDNEEDCSRCEEDQGY